MLRAFKIKGARRLSQAVNLEENAGRKQRDRVFSRTPRRKLRESKRSKQQAPKQLLFSCVWHELPSLSISLFFRQR